MQSHLIPCGETALHLIKKATTKDGHHIYGTGLGLDTIHTPRAPLRIDLVHAPRS